MNVLRLHRRNSRFVLALAGLLAAPTLAISAQTAAVPASELHAGYMADLQEMGDKFVQLAEAMGSDTYSWRPMDSVRTVSEVFMLIAAETYALPNALAAEMPAGITVDGAFYRNMAAITDKDDVVAHVRQGFALCTGVVADLTADQMNQQVRFFGRERPVHDALFVMIRDMHEHLGQAIAYARMNEVVPPWTARRRSDQ